MAVRTHDIALGGLRQDTRYASPADHACYALVLNGGVQVVEVHHARAESLGAVRARNIPETIEKARLCPQADRFRSRYFEDPGDLLLREWRCRVRSRWQFAHTTSHFATSAMSRGVAISIARPVITLNDLVAGSRWSKSIWCGWN